MLDHIGYVNLVPIDSCGFQTLVQYPSRRSDKRFSLDVFTIARLFPHKHHFGVSRSFAKNRLSTSFPQIASAATSRDPTKLLQIGSWRNERFGGTRFGLLFSDGFMICNSDVLTGMGVT